MSSTLICGPCVIEGKKSSLRIAEEMNDILNSYDNQFDFYFKGSCVKDNRSTITNFQGIGFPCGIINLKTIKKRFGFKITTDFHTPEQVKEYGSEVDLIQIPAYLAMQTELLVEAAKCGKPINIKKPQFMNPKDIYKPIDKIKETANVEVYVTDRGTCFGYNEVMMDPRHISLMREHYADKIFVDITHPQNHSDIYDWTDAKALAIAYSKLVDGFFMETHYNTQLAKCDGDCMIPINHLKVVLNHIC